MLVSGVALRSAVFQRALNWLGLTVGAAALLVNIAERKQEAKNSYVKLVQVTENDTDPAKWGTNWPREYDSYLKTVEPSRTNFGGGDASPAEKADRFPWLTRVFAGYAFSLDYRDRRGHGYMLLDQEKRRCTVYEARPGVCRKYPDSYRCGYYDFLRFEREQQDDQELIALT